MKLIDKYILKNFLNSFLLVMALLLPIAIAIDVSEKVDRFLRNADLTIYEIIKDYYVNFIVIYGNTFMPLALFIAVIFFTSKLAGNTEIIAIHSAKISFTRFLKPYFFGATIIAIFALLMNHFVVPKSNKIFDKFNKDYLTSKKLDANYLTNLNLQLSPNEYIFFKSFTVDRNIGYNFSYEKYDGIKLKYKLSSDNIHFNKKDSTYRLVNFKKRIIYKKRDSIIAGTRLDTTFNFTPRDLINVSYMAKDMSSIKLNQYINQSQKRGVSNLNTYKVELHKRTSLPIASYILTFIAVALSSRKKRGGMGINLAIGISLMFLYVFFLKIGEVLGAGADANPLFMVWLPNFIFGTIALFLYFKNAKN